MENGHGGLFAMSPFDSDAFVTSELEAMKDEPTDKPLLAIAGASVTYSSFGTEEEIQRDFRKATGIDVDVALLSSGRIPISSANMILDRLPKNRPVIAVLGIGPSRFTMDRTEVESPYRTTRFGITSPADQAIRKDLGVNTRTPTGFVAIDQGGFYIARLGAFVRNLALTVVRGHGMVRNDERYIGLTASDKFLELRAQAVVSRFENAEANWNLNARLLERAIRLAQSRKNITLVMVEHPINPDFVANQLGQDRYAAHLAKMDALARRNNVTYWKLGYDLKLDRTNFYDWAHISSEEGQGRLRRLLVQRIGKLER